MGLDGDGDAEENAIVTVAMLQQGATVSARSRSRTKLAPRHDDLFWSVALMSLPQLVDRAAAVAAVLAELDVHRNERVLIMLPDEPGFDESFAGAVHQDAVPLPVSPRLRAHDLAAGRRRGRGPRGVGLAGSAPCVDRARRRASDIDQWTRRAVGSCASTAVSAVRGTRDCLRTWRAGNRRQRQRWW